MFDFGFSEVLLTSVIALIVLGPEKLPKAASQVGRWVGRARAMARQFREQLEEEVNLETVKKAHKEEEARREAEAKRAAASGSGGAGGTSTEDGQNQGSAAASGTGSAGPAGSTEGQNGGTATALDPSVPAAGTHDATATRHGSVGANGSQGEDPYVQPVATPNPHFGDPIAPDRPEVHADTFSHAHPTNEFGANPLTPDGAAEPPSSPAPATTSEPHRPETGEAYASTSTPASQTPATADSPLPPEKSGPA